MSQNPNYLLSLQNNSFFSFVLYFEKFLLELRFESKEYGLTRNVHKIMMTAWETAFLGFQFQSLLNEFPFIGDFS